MTNTTKMNTILKWKLSEKPSVDNIQKLVADGIITKEEARKIVIDIGEVNQSDIEEMKSELSLLRKMLLELAEKSERKTEIIKIIEKEIPIYIEKYKYIPHYPNWWSDNIKWCANNGSTIGLNAMNQMNSTITQPKSPLNYQK